MMELANGRVSLKLHQLTTGEGLPLLCLHQLGGSSRDFQPPPPWPGPVYALDLTGHGQSGRLYGAAYNPELLAADADAVLASLGPCALLGVGLGAYVALLLAGCREEVPLAVLVDGWGISGGGEDPQRDIHVWQEPTRPRAREIQEQPSTDKAALTYLSVDPRPAPYAVEYAQTAQRLVVRSGDVPADWWTAVASLDGVECNDHPIHKLYPA